MIRGHTTRLWPHSSITAGVTAMNAGGRGGDMSDTIEFQTPEGGQLAARY